MRHFAFLRAINVGGHTVTMAALRGHFEALGHRDVETFIASGNVIFSSSAKNVGTLERTIEAHLEKKLGYAVTTFIRNAEDVFAIAKMRPFPPARIAGAGAFCIGFLTRPLDPAKRRALASLQSDIDDFHTEGREVYWLCKKRQHESKFSNVVFEKTTGAKITFRSATTIAKLATLAGKRS